MYFLLFLGSTRLSTPPKPARLGEHVSNACLMMLRERYCEHTFELIDPLDFDLNGAFKPHFSYAKGRAPASLDALADKISSADGYIMVSPEYNHSFSPALANLLNHFGSSRFSFKPSVIATYSAGQWGGMRAAVGLRSFLSELGCLPVSAMIHIPKAQEVFARDGSALIETEADNWKNYLARAFNQLIWWAEASREQREKVDPFTLSQAFKKDPSERNIS